MFWQGQGTGNGPVNGGIGHQTIMVMVSVALIDLATGTSDGDGGTGSGNHEDGGNGNDNLWGQVYWQWWTSDKEK